MHILDAVQLQNIAIVWMQHSQYLAGYLRINGICRRSKLFINAACKFRQRKATICVVCFIRKGAKLYSQNHYNQATSQKMPYNHHEKPANSLSTSIVEKIAHCRLGRFLRWRLKCWASTEPWGYHCLTGMLSRVARDLLWNNM